MGIGISSNYINEEGYTRCVSCRKKIFIKDAQTCEVCQKFVCPSCRKYRKQGNPYGYVCLKCM